MHNKWYVQKKTLDKKLFFTKLNKIFSVMAIFGISFVWWQTIFKDVPIILKKDSKVSD